MPASPKLDLFAPAQGELFVAPAAPAYTPNPDHVRWPLETILAAARAAAPLSEAVDERSLYRAAFPNLLRHFAPAESEQRRLAFDAEIARIHPA